jgi:hypothetical protein
VNNHVKFKYWYHQYHSCPIVFCAFFNFLTPIIHVHTQVTDVVCQYCINVFPKYLTTTTRITATKLHGTNTITSITCSCNFSLGPHLYSVQQLLWPVWPFLSGFFKFRSSQWKPILVVKTHICTCAGYNCPFQPRTVTLNWTWHPVQPIKFNDRSSTIQCLQMWCTMMLKCSDF